MAKCAYCEHNDGAVYTSYPPKYRCTVTGEYHLALDDCDVEFAPVVRCKDCKWYSRFISMTGKLLSEGRCEYHSNYFAEDDYCSRGERKNG